jgi:hypothetical protein
MMTIKSSILELLSGEGGSWMDCFEKPYKISFKMNKTLGPLTYTVTVLLSLVVLVSSSNVTYSGFNYSISIPQSPLEVYRSAKSEYFNTDEIFAYYSIVFLVYMYLCFLIQLSKMLLLNMSSQAHETENNSSEKVFIKILLSVHFLSKREIAEK